MDHKVQVLAILGRIAKAKGWPDETDPLVQEALETLPDCAAEFVDALLEESDEMRKAAYECLRLMRLPDSIVKRLQNIVTDSDDVGGVAWSLLVLGDNEYTGLLPKAFVERAVQLGGDARATAALVMPSVDAEEEELQAWLLELFDTGDDACQIRAMQASLRISDEFAMTLLERGCTGTRIAVASEALFFVWYWDLAHDWTVTTIRSATTKWPTERGILLPALHCINSRELRELEDVVVPAVRHEAQIIAGLAAETIALLFPVHAKSVLADRTLPCYDRVAMEFRAWLPALFGGGAGDASMDHPSR